MVNVLRVLFPALMVIGAFGSFVVNVISKGESTISIQWIGATFLYIALLKRNR
jgi:hypothetical protein